MKKVYIILILSYLAIAGCKDILIEPLSSSTDANFWKTKDEFVAFRNGIHGALRTDVPKLWDFGSIRSDEFDRNGFGGLSVYDHTRAMEGTLNPDFPYILSFGGLYTNINQINLFISKVSSSDVLVKKDKDFFLGQAYGLRAFYYYYLLRSYGDVVLHKDPTTSFDINQLAKPASKATEVMAFIKQDIESSLTSFATDYTLGTVDKSYWSKAATLMLKGDVFLWSAKQMGGGNADAAIAKAALTDIQTNIPKLKLQPNFKDVFSLTNKNNDEIILGVRYQQNECIFFTNSPTPVDANWWHRVLPRQQAEQYYDSLATRKINAATDYVGNEQGTFSITIRNSTFWRFSNLDSRKAASIKGAYRLVGTQYQLYGAYVSKYPYEIISGQRYLLSDFPIYRYADLLLMLAEAKSMLGENPATEINLVRQRAYGTNFNAALHAFPNKAGDSDVNEALLNERLFEFVAEGKRWFDLRRFGKNYVFKYTTSKQDFQLLWPIDKIALTNNRALAQNPGY
jgi:hypothetical protein